jgi:hypothetical protein
MHKTNMDALKADNPTEIKIDAASSETKTEGAAGPTEGAAAAAAAGANGTSGSVEGGPATGAGATGAAASATGAAGAGVDATGVAKTAEQIEKEKTDKEAAEKLEKDAQQKVLDKFGVKTLEELEAKLNPKAPETEEEKKQKAENYRAAVNQYAVTNKLLSNDEIVQLEQYKKATPEELVFQDFSNKFLEKTPAAKKEDIEAAYKIFYNVGSENEFLKEAGEKAIAERAASIKGQLETKYEEAKSDFDQVQSKKEKVPAFKAHVQSVLSQIPGELIIHGEGDNAIKFIVKESERAELEKLLVNGESFDEFFESKDPKQLGDKMKSKALDAFYVRNKDAIFSAIYEAAHSKGLKGGSTTGASSSFPLDKGGAGQGSGAADTDQKVLADGDSKLRRAKGLPG